MPGEQERPSHIFISCADADRPYLQTFEGQLSTLMRQRRITCWHRSHVQLGEEPAKETRMHLDRADLILLLISPDFHIDIECESEVSRAMERWRAGKVRIVPILLRPTDWQATPYSQFQVLPRDGRALTLWPNIDEAFLDIVKELRSVLADLNKPASSMPLAPITPAISLPIENIPHERNPFFTGRDEIIEQIARALRSTNAAALTQAIQGLGGVGKTQTAIEYAYRYQQDYEHIFWVRAESSETLTIDFSTIARQRNLPEQNEKDPNRIIAAVKHWFTQHERWLLIFDNADDLTILPKFLPSKPRGHTLLTTRVYATGSIGIPHKIELNKMGEQDGALLLLRRAGRLAPTSTLDDASEADRQDAYIIVRLLDGLPLALDQAGAYLEATGERLASYPVLFQTYRTQLLQERGGLTADHAPVATTWKLAFERLTNSNPAAIELLQFCAFLTPDAIPEVLLTEGAEFLGPTLQAITTDRFQFNKALADLLNYALITRDQTTETLSMHRLVQIVIQDEMDEAQQKHWAERAIKAVDELFPFDEDAPWPHSQRVFTHALTCIEHVKCWNITIFAVTHLLTTVAVYLRQRGQYSEAEPFFQQALDFDKKVLGFEHLHTTSSLNNLAALYTDQGKYDQAEPLYQQSLTILQKLLGSEHPGVATALNNLANLYNDQSQYDQAEPLYQQSLTIRQKLLGPDHPLTARILNNLASLYNDQGKYDQAEPLYQQSLTIRQKLLGSEHPEIATALNNLANLYRQQGKYDQAEPLYQQALGIRQKLLGPEHPFTANVLGNLAILYRHQGKFDLAESLYQQVLAIYERVFDAEHPDIKRTKRNYELLQQARREAEVDVEKGEVAGDDGE